MSSRSTMMKNKNRKPKAQRRPTQVDDESDHDCEVCLVSDDEPKVRCDECQLWYHFDCANVSGGTLEKMDRWSCHTCNGKGQQQSTPINVQNPPTISITVEDNNPTNAVSQPTIGQIATSQAVSRPTIGQIATSQAVISQPNIGRTASSLALTSQATLEHATTMNPPSETRHGQTNKSQKSKSVASSVSRRTSLALQRLEEEKQLREKREREDKEERDKRDQEYLSKKYSILEADSGDDISLTDEEQERFRFDRIQQWTEELPNVEEHLVVDLLKMNVCEPHPALESMTTERNNNLNNQPSRPNNVRPSAKKSQRGSDKSSCLSQKSNTNIMKPKLSKSSLPAWLIAPSKPTLDIFTWKSPSAISKTTTTITAPSTVSAAQYLLPSFEPKAPNFQTQQYSLATGSHTQSTSSTTSAPLWSLNSRNTKSHCQASISNTQSTMSNVHQVSTKNVSSSNEPFYFGLRPTTANNAVHQNGGHTSTVTSAQFVNPAFPITSQLNIQESSIVTSTSRPQFHVKKHKSKFVDTGPAYQTTFVCCGQEPALVAGNNRPPITSSRIAPNAQSQIVSDVQGVNTNAPTYYSSVSHSNNNAFGHANHGHFPNNNTNQNVNSGNTSQSGTMASNMSSNVFGQTNNSHRSYIPNNGLNQSGSGNMMQSGVTHSYANNNLLSNRRARLTAEQIAARTVIPKLPQFFGDPKYWQAFISSYEFSTDECGFTDVENLGRLRECLKGDAHDAVGSRLIHPNSVPAVMNTLRMLYGRPEQIIESLIEKIRKEPSPRDDDLAAFIKFAIAVQNLCGSIEETGAVEHLRNPTLINTITDKLPTQVQLNWAYYRHSIGVVDLSTLGNWLYGLADVASQVVRKPVAKTSKKKDNDKSNHSDTNRSNYLNTQVENKTKKQETAAANQKETKKCLACKSESCSKISTCSKFKSLSRSEKWTLVKESKLCSRCLGAHSFYRCRSEQGCKAKGCTKNHHTLLHDYEKSSNNSKDGSKDGPKSPVSENKSNEAEEKPPTSTCNSQRSKDNRRDIFRIVPIVLYHKDKVIKDFAYMDDGSNLTLMEDGLANKLGLVGTPEAVCIDWAFGQAHESEESRIVTTKISGFYHQAPSFKLENVRTVKDLHLPTQSLTAAWLERYPHLENIPIVAYEAAKPRMLIGLQYSKLMVSLETIEGNAEEPICCRTRLGWVVQGPSYEDDDCNSKKFSLNICQCQVKDNKLHQLVKEYFSIENFGVTINDKLLESKQIQRARQILESTTIKKDGRYECGLLWKYDQIDLPDSYGMALKRLQCLETKMAKNPQLSENLCSQIQQFVEKGYIRKLTPSELEVKNDRQWYLPIFPVFNPKKPDKVRIVWDAAAKVKKISLNSMLLTGPDLLVPLVDILRRFRERLIAILGDIREMYHQIKIIERDQNVQRFLWRDGDSSKRPDVYIMLVATFGAACSPSTAQFVKNKNATEYKQNFPEAVDAIINSTYVDDLLDCVHKLEEAVKLVGDVKYVNQQGGFETRNFLSNSKELLAEIGERNATQNKNLNINTDVTLGTERVLGMFWNAETDNFTYSLKYTRVSESILNGAHCPTKREVLRLLMSIFDPLGLLANFLVYAKILLQEIWRSNIDWDEQITTPFLTKWVKWTTALKDVGNVQIPRLYSPKLSPGTPNSIQLHVFVDAGIEAFAAAAYLRVEDDVGVDCCMVGAKTKVAPNKPMSVPRLELQAGVLGARLSTSIKSSQRLEIEKVVYWSDSKTVMGWINSEVRRYHQFVAFRIGEILESTDSTEWRWVPSEHNVADEATKSKLQQLNSSSRWLKGPKFLYDEESTWFTEENQNEHHTDEETRPGFIMACRQGQNFTIIDVKKFSSWHRLVRVMAYVCRYVHNLRKATNKRTGPLMNKEIIRGEVQLHRIAQRDYYLDEIAILESNANLPLDEQKYVEKSSDLFKCSPYLDNRGVLRIKGRLDAAKCLSPETKRPIILPRRHYITKLIVDAYHRRYLHLNHQTALNEIKQKYAIPALRVVMKEIRNSCQQCKNDSAVPQIPEMAELPFARLAAYERPFTYVGIDYFGPFKVKITRNCSAKRWGVLYTCLTTRAIHLEVASSLSTSSCIMAFERFGTACGFPREVYSDNGSNFHGMENELKEEFKKLNQEEIQKTFTSSEIQWSFNPPASPHMGGAWERLIRTVKNCFKKIVRTRNPTDETLPTLFAQVENIVNSRPLTYVSLDSADDEALTPNHFLFGSSNGRKPITNTSPKDLNRNDWRNIQEQTNQFWRRFVLEYMPTLTKRTKWFKQSKPVEVGDVVVIVDEKNPRNTWPKGIVEQTIIGRGGKRRQAIVRVVSEGKNGPVHKEFRRSVHKLAVLDVKMPATEVVNRQTAESINGGETVGQH